MLCPDGNRSDAVRTAAGLDVCGNGKPSFSKTTVVLQSRTALPTFPQTPPPSSLVIGMPHFDQKLDELTAERQAARCAAEAMANLSVLPVSAMSLPPTVSGTMDLLQSVAVASAAEPEHRASPLATISSTSAAVTMEVEPSDVTDSLAASYTDKYSSYDRHFKKKFFGTERRPHSSEPIAKVGDADHATADSGRDGNTSSPDVMSSVPCKKVRLAEQGRNTISPLCAASVRTSTPPVCGVTAPPVCGVTAPVSTASHDTEPSSGNDISRGSPCTLVATPATAASSAAPASSVEVTSSASETLAQFSVVERGPEAASQSTSDSCSGQPTNV